MLLTLFYIVSDWEVEFGIHVEYICTVYPSATDAPPPDEPLGASNPVTFPGKL
jgi:hypothetical protein